SGHAPLTRGSTNSARRKKGTAADGREEIRRRAENCVDLNACAELRCFPRHSDLQCSDCGRSHSLQGCINLVRITWQLPTMWHRRQWSQVQLHGELSDAAPLLFPNLLFPNLSRTSVFQAPARAYRGRCSASGVRDCLVSWGPRDMGGGGKKGAGCRGEGGGGVTAPRGKGARRQVREGGWGEPATVRSM